MLFRFTRFTRPSTRQNASVSIQWREVLMPRVNLVTMKHCSVNHRSGQGVRPPILVETPRGYFFIRLSVARGRLSATNENDNNPGRRGIYERESDALPHRRKRNAKRKTRKNNWKVPWKKRNSLRASSASDDSDSAWTSVGGFCAPSVSA